MDFQGLKTITVEDVGEWITNADLKSLAENFALEIRGNRITKEGMIFQGDFGSQHRFYKYPIRPNKAMLITGASGTPITITITGVSLGIIAGQLIYVNDVNGNTGANGVFVAGTVIEVGGVSTTVILTGSTTNSAYTSGGVCSVSPITIIYGTTLIDSSTGYEHEIIVGVDSGSATRIFIDTSSDSSGTWLELTELIGTTLNGTPSTNTTVATIATTGTENSNTLTLTDTVRFPTNYFRGWVAYNFTRGNYAHITSSTTTPTITSYSVKLGSDGLGWVTGDSILLFRNSEVYLAGFTGSVGFYTYQNSTAPQIRMLTKGSKRKVTIFYGDPSTKTFGKPMQLIRRTSNFPIFSTSGSQSFYSGWYLRNAQMPQVVCAELGTIGTPLLNGASGKKYIYDGIGMDYTITQNVLASTATLKRVLVTLQFGEQESDPILKLCAFAPGGYTINIATMNFYFDIGKLPKGLTGVNLYSFHHQYVSAGVTELGGGSIEDDFSLYNLIGTIDLDTGWNAGGFAFKQDTIDSVVSYWAYTNSPIVFTHAYIESVGYGNGNGSILSRLGHVPDFNRSYLTPRFGITTKETRGAFNVVDEDDNTIRRSAYSGLATNMDDDYVDLTVDQQGERQQWDLTSSGELYGLAGNDDLIIALKRYTIEFIDPQSGIIRSIPADVIAKDSIVETPYGVAWCGRNGIYFLRSGTYTPEIMNPLWIDRYDGTSFVTGTTQYITDANRSAAVGGYNPFYDELMFSIITSDTSSNLWKYVYRYSFGKQRWTVRTFELGISAGYASNVAIKYFSKRNDGTLTIGAGTGLFKYPSTLYTDGSRTTQTGVTLGGNGFERYLKFNFGSIYNLLKSNFFKIFLLEKAMTSVNNTDYFTIKFYANFLSTAFETKTSVMADPMLPRAMPPRGTVETLQVEISNTGAEVNTKQFDITTFFAGLSQATRTGNR